MNKCPRCEEARRQVAATGLTVSNAPDHGDDFCAAQSVETHGPATYNAPKAYVQVRPCRDPRHGVEWCPNGNAKPCALCNQGVRS